ncbi:WXG100 family type VII secretion target [Cryobacterium sp. 10I1]|uniref:WXG100 family type VII secretion target n=1 Tax=unclassified Cryobacterium TaxID=2649013 RepID=UPI002AB38549|nr:MULTISPECIES: WXG100 family type VII secretion target [unclassified Cryobacterium]MDY7540848.1 WXG100 family type VII secretion target [Cryobacterium sp. 5B3]MEA9999812.1 WXG100 family type VII secretion target [Cryobacterium sp. RTS3]MEB0002473.1 WXG100 family type VII secretion target [Cryobacterium sp. RTC2.1]MEB0203666.1 WXG100 family type VII secretion target [Cryobacterium sp. 5I3]MEB0267439.1 WXG100 family type VII secretion target [Cryobacterium sp. 10I5]
MAVWGLDVEQVRQLSGQLSQKAGDIESVLSTLTNTLGNTQWTGPDSESFRSDWSGQHTTALRQVIEALKNASQKAQANAQAQEEVSRG